MFLGKVFTQFTNGSFGRSPASRQAVKANPYQISVIERKKESRSKGHGHLGYFLMQFTSAFRTCISPASWIPLLFDDGILLFLLNS